MFKCIGTSLLAVRGGGEQAPCSPSSCLTLAQERLKISTNTYHPAVRNLSSWCKVVKLTYETHYLGQQPSWHRRFALLSFSPTNDRAVWRAYVTPPEQVTTASFPVPVYSKLFAVLPSLSTAATHGHRLQSVTTVRQNLQARHALPVSTLGGQLRRRPASCQRLQAQVIVTVTVLKKCSLK